MFLTEPKLALHYKLEAFPKLLVDSVHCVFAAFNGDVIAVEAQPAVASCLIPATRCAEGLFQANRSECFTEGCPVVAACTKCPVHGFHQKPSSAGALNVWRGGGVTHKVLLVGVFKKARFTSSRSSTLSMLLFRCFVMNDEKMARNAIHGGVAVKRLSTPGFLNSPPISLDLAWSKNL
eukprot:636068-Amphidinium_carterae.1